MKQIIFKDKTTIELLELSYEIFENVIVGNLVYKGIYDDFFPLCENEDCNVCPKIETPEGNCNCPTPPKNAIDIKIKDNKKSIKIYNYVNTQKSDPSYHSIPNLNDSRIAVGFVGLLKQKKEL